MCGPPLAQLPEWPKNPRSGMRASRPHGSLRRADFPYRPGRFFRIEMGSTSDGRSGRSTRRMMPFDHPDGVWWIAIVLDPRRLRAGVCPCLPGETERRRECCRPRAFGRAGIAGDGENSRARLAGAVAGRCSPGGRNTTTLFRPGAGHGACRAAAEDQSRQTGLQRGAEHRPHDRQGKDLP